MAGSTGGLSALSFTIPWASIADLQNGDVVLFPWVHFNTTVLTPPAALTELSRQNDGGCQVVWYGRTIDGSEAGDLTFTSDFVQRHSGLGLHYRGIKLPLNDIDYVQEVAAATSPMDHTAPTVHPMVADAVVVTAYAERTGTPNTEGTLTQPANYVIREEIANPGSGGTFISVADDGGTITRAADIDVTPSAWSCPIGSATALMTTIALERV